MITFEMLGIWLVGSIHCLVIYGNMMPGRSGFLLVRFLVTVQFVTNMVAKLFFSTLTPLS